mgnify:FL=1
MVKVKKKVGIVIGIIIIIAILVVGIVYLVDLNRMNNNEPVLFSTWGRDYEQEKTNTKLDEERSLKVTFDQYVTQADVDRVESIEVIDEAKEIQDMIYNADFSEETCDGVSIYSINFENGENYGLEIFDENCHITYGNTEAVLTKEDSQRLKEILDKYTLKNVTMDVKDGSLTRNGVTVIITDTNKEHYSYDEWYRIDKFEVDGWQELEPITDDYAFTDIAWLIGEDNTLEDKVDWSDLYGELEDGRYRLVKRIYDGGAYKYFSTDFYLGDDTEIIN